MMPKLCYYAVIVFLTGYFNFNACYSQQYLVNSEWATTFGNDTSNYLFKRAVVKTDINDNVYTLGSSITSTGHDFLLLKQNKAGDTLYLVNWNGDGDGEDVAMDMWVDPTTGYVYVVGGSVQNGTDSLDAVLVVFDDLGGIPYYTYSSSSGAYNDIYTSIVSDGSTYLYATGTVYTAVHKYDYLLTEFDYTATETHSDTYDNGFDDIAIKVVYDSDELWVAGISESNDSTWDYYMRQYKASSFDFTGEYRNYAGSGQLHQPTDAVFANGYYYITGGIKDGADYDIKTLCLDTTLAVVWEQTWDGGDSMSDVAYSVKVNDLGDVFITGQTGLSNYTSNMVTIKYDHSGTLQWAKYYDGSDGSHNDGGYDVEIKNDNVFVTGYVNDGYDYVTLCYDTSGNTRWIKTTPLGLATRSDMAVDNDNNVIVAIPLYLGLSNEKISVLEVSNAIISDTSGAPVCKKNEVIIKFNPQVIKTDIIDNRNKVFGKLTDFIQDSTIIKMSAKIGFDLTKADGINVIKIFKRFTTADSLSLSRLGDTVRIEEIWSTLTVTIPDTSNLLSWMDSLKTIMSDIYYVEENSVVSFFNTPNDTRYSFQENLNSSTYPNAHINAESAWDIETGQPFIKVGVYDTGIDWEHPDLTRSGTIYDFNSSIAHTGYDYYNNLPITSSYQHMDDFLTGHGTLVAGIIGARRNNNQGVAGIAGGDGTYSSGVELYNFKVSPYVDLAGITNILNAVMEGGYFSMNPVGNIGYGINISNHSYGWPSSSLTYPYMAGTYFTSRKVYYYTWRNGVTQAAARGNYPNAFNSTESIKIYPSCLNDDWLICVSASGNNGHIMNGTNGAAGETWLSMYGQPQVDCAAPGVLSLVQYTTNALYTTPSIFYDSFNGTSAATPHVTGAAALIESYYNNSNPNPYAAASFSNLCSDDVEHLIQTYASDVNWGNGYSLHTGWGLLNIGEIFANIKRPQYDILHFHGNDPTSLTSTKIDSNIIITIDEPIFGYGYPAGSYTADRYEVQATFNHTLPAGYTLVDYWPLKSHAQGMANASLPLPNFPTEIEIISCNSTSIVLKTYIYNIQSPVQYSGWLIGMDKTLTRFPYALHISTPTAAIEEQKKSNIKVYPNPTTEILNISVPIDSPFKFIIFDINGRVELNGSLNDTNTMIDLSTLSSGIYFIKVFNENSTETFKVIKY